MNKKIPHHSEKSEPAASIAAPNLTSPAIPVDAAADETLQIREIGGRKGPEPTRYGDWELAGKCVDF